MADFVDGLAIRKALGRKAWSVPRPFGSGYIIDCADGDARIIVTSSDVPRDLAPDLDDDWVHASFSRRSGLPSYDDLVLLHRAVWGDGYAYQVFVPPAQHINISPNVLHLWGRADGRPVLPDFGRFGTI
ncbi:hypothetical protein AB0425_17820 [Actinosynnema sp. NPDC051121]